MTNVPDLPLGLHEHYKHQLYYLLGIARSLIPSEQHHWEPFVTAHFSEKPSLHRQVLFAKNAQSDCQFGVVDSPQFGYMVLYRAMYHGDGPRFAFRPLDGEAGWLTQVRPGVDRFWLVSPDRVAVPLTQRHDFDGSHGNIDGIDVPICRTCLEPAV